MGQHPQCRKAAGCKTIKSASSLPSINLILPLVMWAVVAEISPGAMSNAISSMRKVVAQFTEGTSLRVIDGITDANAPDSYNLSSSNPIEITLMEQNRIEVTVVSEVADKPFVMLKPLSDAATQTFRLTASKGDEGIEAQSIHTIAFNVRETSELYVSTLSTNEPAATIKVLRLPVPQVSLGIQGERQDPWPDEQPLPLAITANAENPLQLIRLQIKSEGQTHTELVSNILAQDKTKVSTTYSLLLENYVQRDIATIEIVAEAVDRHLPTPFWVAVSLSLSERPLPMGATVKHWIL